MITETKQIKIEGQRKTAKAWKAAKLVAKNAFFTALIIGGLAAGESAVAQRIDTGRVEKPDKELVLKKTPVKPYLSLKGFGRLYNGGKTEGLGLGVETGADIGKITIGGTGSIVKEGDKVKLEESSLFIAVPLGKFKLMGYGYTDLFLKQTVPAYGLNVKWSGVKVGAEISPYKDADGCWVGYVKVPFGSFTPGLGIAGWGNAGWQGGVRKMMLTFNTSHDLGNGVALSTETLYGIKLEKGSEGSIQFRMTVTKEF